MWKNIVQSARPQKTVRRMRIACWTAKTTDTHSEYEYFSLSKAKMVKRMHLNVTCNINCLSWRHPLPKLQVCSGEVQCNASSSVHWVTPTKHRWEAQLRAEGSRWPNMKPSYHLHPLVSPRNWRLCCLIFKTEILCQRGRLPSVPYAVPGCIHSLYKLRHLLRT